jgi:predicted esterase
VRIGTVKDAIDFVEKQPGVDKMRISLLGHSLGAQLALHESATDQRVYAVIDMAGCFVLPTQTVRKMPPVLILHGTADSTVGLGRERAMVAVLKRCGAKYEEHLFKGADHGFGSVPFRTLMHSVLQFLRSPGGARTNGV